MSKIGQIFAQYKILSSLGVGGMGEVYLAEDTKLGRRAALKFLASELKSDPVHLERFWREARAASALNHPNICTIYEISESGPNPFIAMEYIEGETLAEIIRWQRLSVRQTVDIAIEAVAALSEAHAKGVIHRDIKPANIIVSKTGRVKILDFG
ncbi:MAG: protein kinase, partial [Pyrinomonadaceae bacterium]